MAATAADYFKKASNGSTRPVPTTLTAIHSGGGTTMTCNSLTGWPTDTGVAFCIYTTDTSGNKVAGSQTDWTGTVVGSTITNCVLKAGTDSGYSIGAIVEAAPIAAWADGVATGALVQHAQDGTHTAVTATSVTATTGTFTNLTVTGTATSQGWTPLGATPATVTANGNRNYDLVFNSVDLTSTLSPGMKLQLTRTVAAPSQCTSLNGTTQYYSRASGSVNGMTFTDDFTCSAWIKVSSYAAGTIMSRNDGSNGWNFQMGSNGQITIGGNNGGGGNARYITSYASVPLNKWVHVSASLDMSGWTTATNKMAFDGVDVAVSLNSAGTNPTSLTQAGNLNIGAQAGASFFPGKIAQAAIYTGNASTITQAILLARMDRTLSGSETSLISAYSFNNSINDLNANANNLTANGSAVATNADSPFANAVTAGLIEYAEINSVAFSTNTTVNVRVPDTCQIPTTGGVSAVSYSTQSNPYGLPAFTNVIGHSFIRASAVVAVGGVLGTGVDVPGLSTTVYVPAGRRLKLKAWPAGMESSVGAPPIIAIQIMEGSSIVALGMCAANGASTRDFAYAEAIVLPTAGSHTYKVQVSCNNAGNVQLFASIGAGSEISSFIEAELV